MSSSIRAKAFHEELMELPLPDVPVCIWIHRDEEGLKQPEGRQLQPPQVGISLQELHADRVVYQPRTPRKVVSKCMHCYIMMQRCSFHLGMQESLVHSI